MNNITASIIGILLILGIGGLVYWQNNDMSAPAETNTGAETTNNSESGSNTQSNEGLTATEVATHADKSSCWSIINGNVYDLTSWVPKHPGGEQAILQICGKDGSSKFNGQHGGAATQAQILSGFKIGVLAQ